MIGFDYILKQINKITSGVQVTIGLTTTLIGNVNVVTSHINVSDRRTVEIVKFHNFEICEKLIFRHPHIYGNIKVNNEEDVKRNWEQLKLKEGKKSVLEGVPQSLPAVIKASRIQEKVAGIGFDWEQPEQVWDKVQEELSELNEEIKAGNNENIEKEFGDVLFSMINYARFINVNPENALEKTNKKFINRFQYLERESKKEGKNLADMSLAEMDIYWEKSKEFFK